MTMGLESHPQVQSRLLALPRELRDMVYTYYTTTADGYRFSPETRRLTLAAGSFIDFGLMYTCKLIAIEMKALHLRVNAVHFWTSCEGKDRITSEALDSRLRHHFVLLCAILREARAFIDDDVVRYVRETHPPFLPHIEQLRMVRRNYTLQLDIWGAVPSLHRHFVYGTLQYMLHGPNSAGLGELMYNEDLSAQDVQNLTTEAHPAWQIRKQAYLENPLFDDYRDGKSQRLSAAAIAISFLSSLSSKAKKEMRMIVLHEDEKADAWPECHAQGLIPFCQENPNLHIERQVSLWGNMLPASSGDFMPNDDLTSFKVDSSQITKRGFAPWIAEALALPSLGMPPEAFKLTLDGNPRPDLATEIFAIAQRDALWQMLFENHNMDNSPPQSERWSLIRGNWTYITNGFPGAIRDIVEGLSIVKCNFPTRSDSDADRNRVSEIERLIEVNASWAYWHHGLWGMHWDSRSVHAYEVRTLEGGALDVQRILHH
ncbi:hypothetical protein HBH77_160550 [Parastagonospora nodorum]|nr:hypothetical protein HBH82_128480 [Parastagonospora nodorum]KAH4688535.1 hypothetical protein HBH78_100380 [Parastagonospora nodorum]KAH4706866.1 hypothetical protein HBH67_078360 [Parastagonospora nodorum]KAH4778883.1 hypothetical protein HBH62_146590 [Parastagonospora nodorum]KAH4786429.1 hypothetical protein HBH63_111220 [Parastagonospora nodorum]